MRFFFKSSIVLSMETLKKTVGENLANLRKEKKLTQLELAEMFNYSDKAVSKWETGETLPELEVIYQLCEFYGVTLDYLTHEGSKEDKKQFVKEDTPDVNNIAITCLAGSVPWMIATIIFVYLLVINSIIYYPVFVWGVPLTAIVLLFNNRLVYRNRTFKFVSLSVLTWGLIASVFVTVLYALTQIIWPLFLIGIPMQVSLALWYISKKRR